MRCVIVCGAVVVVADGFVMGVGGVDVVVVVVVVCVRACCL